MSYQDQARREDQAIELRANNATDGFHDANGASSASPLLPRVDGGYAAWLFLFGSFLIETFLWGKLRQF
jgi:hypothetical protein